MFFIGLAIGLFVGCVVGIFIAALCHAGADHHSCAGCPALDCWNDAFTEQ